MAISLKDLSLAFERFSIENWRDLSKNVLTLSVFELEKWLTELIPPPPLPSLIKDSEIPIC